MTAEYERIREQQGRVDIGLDYGQQMWQALENLALEPHVAFEIDPNPSGNQAKKLGFEPGSRAMPRATSRRSHPKSRTGCATCKSRKVKVSKQTSPILWSKWRVEINVPNRVAASVTNPSPRAATVSSTMSNATLSARRVANQARPRGLVGA